MNINERTNAEFKGLKVGKMVKEQGSEQRRGGGGGVLKRSSSQDKFRLLRRELF